MAQQIEIQERADSRLKRLKADILLRKVETLIYPPTGQNPESPPD
jgi:hypothetical protein